MSQLEDLFAFQLKACGISFNREVKLLKARRYRWDFVVGDLAIEVNGGQWVKSGHSSGVGLGRDADKLYEAVKAGYRPLVLTGDLVRSGVGLKRVLELIGLPEAAK